MLKTLSINRFHLFTILTLITYSLLPASEPYTEHLLFSGERDKGSFSCYGNAASELKEQDVKISLGGINSENSGAFQIYQFKNLPKTEELAQFDRISLLIKGDGGSGAFVLIISTENGQTFCWNGKRWEANAEISMADESWHKVQCKLKDFVASTGNSKTETLSTAIGKIKNIQLAVGAQMKDPSRRMGTILLRQITLEGGQESATKNTKDQVSRPAQKEIQRSEQKPSSDYQAAKAELAPGISWDINNHYQEKKGLRERISLNNYWQFKPVEESTVSKVLENKGVIKEPALSIPANGPWYYVKVPGRWDGYIYNVLNQKGETVTKWNGTLLSDFMHAWLKRTFTVPKEWETQKVEIDFSGISARGKLFINGVLITELMTTGKVDISKQLLPGMLNEIALLIQSPDMPVKKGSAKYDEFIRKEMGSSWWYKWHEGPGLNDEVWLHVSPRNFEIKAPSINTSVKNKKISIEFLVKNNSNQNMDGNFSSEILDGENKVCKLPSSSFSLKAGEEKKVTLTASWKNPVYWSPENPKLYTMELSASDKNGQLMDELSEKFGFREISIEGNNFLLNGQKTRLKFISSQHGYERLTASSQEDLLRKLKEMNFNGLIFEATDKNLIEICDRIGLMVMIRHVIPPLVRNGEYLPGVPNQGYPYQIYLSDSEKNMQARAELESVITELVAKFKNNPSIVIWAINPLLCWNSDWINPDMIDTERAENDVTKASLKEENFIKSIDPARLVQHSMGSNTGSIIAANPYPTFCNQPDEWADWPMKWQKKKPLVLEEVCVPYSFDFATWYQQSKRRNSDWNEMKQLYMEQSARYLGNKAYLMYSDKMKDGLWSNIGDYYENKADGSKVLKLNEAAETVTALWMERCFKSWRTYDVSGIWPFDSPMSYFNYGSKEEKFSYNDITAPGRKPDYGTAPVFSEKNLLFRTIQKIQAPLLVYIAGRQEKLSSREHCFSSGEKVQKSIVISNDAQTAKNVKAEWTVKSLKDMKLVASGSLDENLSAGEIRKLPLEWKAPPVSQKEKFVIELTSLSDNFKSNDTVEISVFPMNEKFSMNEEVLLYDEKNITADMLRKMNVKFTTLKDESQLKTHKILIVGRESFSKIFSERFKTLKVSEAIENGLTMLVFEQDLNSDYSEYLEERRVRQVFFKDAAHPLLKGLEESDFQYWRGESDMVTAYPEGSSAKVGRFKAWGSEGTVASFVMDKPFNGKFRIILDCDADLSRAVLFEFFSGKGRIIFSQLDICSRYGKDPVVNRMSENLLKYAASQNPSVSVKTFYSGSDREFRILGQSGFKAEKIADKQNLKDAEILILGEKSELSSEVIALFVKNGGTLVSLAKSDSQFKELKLPFEVKIESRKLRGLPLKNQSDLLRGCGNSDFYFNLPTELTLITEIAGQASFPSPLLASFKYGKGEFIFFQLDPGKFTEHPGQYKTQRILANLLSNIGVEAANTMNLGKNITKEIVLSGLDSPFCIDPESKGEKEAWYADSYDDSNWKKIKTGTKWEAQGYTMENPFYKTSFLHCPYDGDAWYRIHVEIPDEYKNKDLVLYTQQIDDLDWVYFNGSLIGHTGEDTHEYWMASRSYKIPKELIKFGKENIIAVRVRDLRGEGGIFGDMRITWEGAASTRSSLYQKTPREILDFDPNQWRQW